MSELKKFDAVLRMSRFSTKRKGCDKKRLSKKACRGKVSWMKMWLEEIGTAVLLFGLMYLVAIIMFSL